MINVPYNPPSGHSLYVQHLAQQSGRTYKEVEWLWNKFTKEIAYEEMMNPTAHKIVGVSDFFNRVGNKVEEFLKNPTGTEMENMEAAQEDAMGDEFANTIDQNMNDMPMEDPMMDDMGAPDMGGDMGVPPPPPSEPTENGLPPEEGTDVTAPEPPAEPTEGAGSSVLDREEI
jgi:hypothetical protein